MPFSLKHSLAFLLFYTYGMLFSAQALSSQEQAMNIRVTANGTTIVFQLNDSNAARELHAQLPLEVTVEDYAGKEKIFYPPSKLSTALTPLANSKTGSLAYYAPWGDVVMFYEDFGKAAGLYELGHAISGTEYIRDLSGTITVEAE